MSANVNVWNIGKLLLTAYSFVGAGMLIGDGSWVGLLLLLSGFLCLGLIIDDARKGGSLL